MNEHTPKKKKSFKKIMAKGCKGAISILLCLLMTPFVSITLGLVEYSRYQSMMELTEELYELTGISLVSDYDPYLHNRFGLLATGQSGTLGENAETLMQTNAKLLGDQVSIENVSVTGKMALSDEEILRQQVLDVSEITAATAIIADDFKLQELLNKLNALDDLNSMMNTMDSLADLTDALSDAVDALENLEAAVKSLVTAINNVKSSATTLASKVSDFYKKMYEKGAVLSQNADEATINEVIGLLTQEDLNELKDIYKSTKTLMSNLDTIKSKLGQLKLHTENFISAVETAVQAVEDLSTTNSVDQEGALSEAAVESLTDVLEDMQSLVEDTLSDIKDSTIQAAKDTVDKIIDNVIEDIGLAGYTTRYSEIVYGTYFQVSDLSPTAKQDLADLLKAIKVCVDNRGVDGLTQFFKDKFIPDINIDVEEILEDVKGTLEKALDELNNENTDKLGTMLTKLVNMAKGLFDLDLFWEPDMNAFVNISTDNPSGYSKFLSAVGDLFTAVGDFKDAIKDVSLRKMLKALGDMLDAIWDMLDAIVTILDDALTSIGNLVKSTVTGDVKALYEKLLISGYMRHNLPCRLESGNFSYDSDNNAVNLDISGKGLTGYSYNDIVRPASYGGQNAEFEDDPLKSKFQKLNKVLSDVKKGAGTDTMFRGAELEYIMAGTNSEIANQIIVFFNIYFMRMLLDLPSIFLDPEVASMAAAATIAAWVVYIIYIIAEPFCDTLLLVNGEEVPLVRTDCWLTSTGIGTFTSKMANVTMSAAMQNYIKEYGGSSGEPPKSNMSTTGGSGLGNANYRTHVLILLLIFVDDADQISRLQDLVELEAKAYYTKNGGTFSMSKTYTAVQITADATFNPFFDLGTYSGGSPLDMSKTLKRMVTY